MNRRISKAFTMIELVFVIVVMGILAKFGVEFLAQAYNSFIHTKINNELQGQSAAAVEFVSARLQHRIKNSVIARESDNSFSGLPGYSTGTAPVLEWVGSDVEGFRGDSMPNWSGVIDLDPTQSTAISLKSPETNTTAIDNLIKVLSNNNSGVNNAALYFIGSDNDMDGYGWDFSTGAFIDQNQVMHPIKRSAVAGEENLFIPTEGNAVSHSVDNNFSGVNVSEYYKLAWTAYAVGIDNYVAGTTNSGDLTLWYDYQPWDGEDYKTDAKKIAIMENVSTFQFMAIGSLIKIQVCTNSALISDEEHSMCKEKTIY
jgi:prepilin-type N-terminal cleavage/methylation domain-containing protein